MERGVAARIRRRAAVLVTSSLLILPGGALCATPERPSAQAGQDSAYDRLPAAARRLIDAALARAGRSSPNPREDYDRLEVPFRRRFESVAAACAALSLSDAENGEILGTALDLVEALDPLDRPPDGSVSAAQVVVALGPGALDRLRRATEFIRIPQGERRPGTVAGYMYRGSVGALRIWAMDSGRALIELVSSH